MKVTKEIVKEYKKHAAQKWHDKAWWNYNVRETTKALDYAISMSLDKDVDTLVQVANNFLKDIK